jgi:hypothetical protein
MWLLLATFNKSGNWMLGIYLRGKVEIVFPFVESRLTNFQDGTGSIWILTKQDLPKLS